MAVDAPPTLQGKRNPLFRHPFRRKTLKPRTGVLYVLGAAALFAARPELSLFVPGLMLVAAGQSLRLWATGYLLKTDELTTAGPYAHLRHPLYLGSLLMGCGFALAAGRLVASVVIPAARACSTCGATAASKPTRSSGSGMKVMNGCAPCLRHAA